MALYAVGYVDADIFSEEDLADKLIYVHGVTSLELIGKKIPQSASQTAPFRQGGP